MLKKIENKFMTNYLLMFILTVIIGFFAYMLLGFANDVLSKTLAKNNFPAKDLMQEDYTDIDASKIVENGGGVQVISSDYAIVFSEGINTFKKDKLTIKEFTDFLIMSKSIGVPFNYDIEYNSEKNFWLVVTFPTSIRIDFSIVSNKSYPSVDISLVVGFFAAVFLFYLLMLAIITIIYSKLTSAGIITPLKKLCASAQQLKEGNYSSRVKLNLKNEFGELENIFNEMAEQIEIEISLRKKSEENRKRLILDISHDLKNPLASIMGYSELCSKNDLSKEEQIKYAKIIYENSLRANNLINDLFNLSKMESPDYMIIKAKVEICEYMRKKIGAFISVLDDAGFTYDFEIPEEEIYVNIDVNQMDRVFQNLISNTIRYNPSGTKVIIGLFERNDEIIISIKDNGIGMTKDIAKDIFLPFVRADNARNSQTGGSGLGLAIVKKIIEAHGGSIILNTEENLGCEFIICIPKN